MKTEPNHPAMEELDEVQIHSDYPNRKTRIDSQLRPDIRDRLVVFLKQNHDCFAWSHADMTDINPDVAVHKLNLDPNYPLVKQKRRNFTPKRNCIINEEV